MREIVVTIRCTDLANEFDLFTEVTGDATTMEVVGLIEIAKKQFIESKQAPTVHEHTPDDADVMHSMCVTPCGPECPPPASLRAPDGAPWYAHLDGPCDSSCSHVRAEDCLTPERPKYAECGQPYPCGHAPDGGNHPMAAGS